MPNYSDNVLMESIVDQIRLESRDDDDQRGSLASRLAAENPDSEINITDSTRNLWKFLYPDIPVPTNKVWYDEANAEYGRFRKLWGYIKAIQNKLSLESVRALRTGEISSELEQYKSLFERWLELPEPKLNLFSYIGKNKNSGIYGNDDVRAEKIRQDDEYEADYEREEDEKIERGMAKSSFRGATAQE